MVNPLFGPQVLEYYLQSVQNYVLENQHDPPSFCQNPEKVNGQNQNGWSIVEISAILTVTIF